MLYPAIFFCIFIAVHSLEIGYESARSEVNKRNEYLYVGYPRNMIISHVNPVTVTWTLLYQTRVVV